MDESIFSYLWCSLQSFPYYLTQTESIAHPAVYVHTLDICAHTCSFMWLKLSHSIVLLHLHRHQVATDVLAFLSPSPSLSVLSLFCSSTLPSSSSLCFYQSRWALSWVTSSSFFVSGVIPESHLRCHGSPAFWSIKQQPEATMCTIKSSDQCCCWIMTHSWYRRENKYNSIDCNATNTEKNWKPKLKTLSERVQNDCPMCGEKGFCGFAVDLRTNPCK